jgi:predicted site-specific integrase-resolvase
MKTDGQTVNADSETFYTLGEVTKILKVSRTTLWRWRNERGLRMVRIHGVIRIRKSDPGSFLDGGAE